jgi:hypothetical protein
VCNAVEAANAEPTKEQSRSSTPVIEKEGMKELLPTVAPFCFSVLYE